MPCGALVFALVLAIAHSPPPLNECDPSQPPLNQEALEASRVNPERVKGYVCCTPLRVESVTSATDSVVGVTPGSFCWSSCKCIYPARVSIMKFGVTAAVYSDCIAHAGSICRPAACWSTYV